MTTPGELAEIVARAWTRPETEHLQMDPILASAIVAQLIEELPMVPIVEAIEAAAFSIREAIISTARQR